MQKRLEQGPLLDERGRLCQGGYATRLVKAYDRRAIKANALRIKEWDYYYVGNAHYGIALTIADNSYMGLHSVSLLDFDRGFHHTQSPMRLFPMGRTGLSSTSCQGNVAVKGRDYELSFEKTGERRRLRAHMDRFFEGKPIAIDVTLKDHGGDSMVIATPFPGKPRAFYYNQKINCLAAEGEAVFDGRSYAFSSESAMGVLDWGRGVWGYANTWYWGSASGLAAGKPFGFNIGYGFGDTSAASENMVFYGHQAHKISRVIFHIPTDGKGREDYLKPWRFDSDDGRFGMDFHPVPDRASYTSIGLIASDQHQVFGRFTGQAILDDGTQVDVKDLMGFAEKVRNRW